MSARNEQRRISTLKAALLKALATAGVARVDIDYDGEGDSGQLTAIDASAADGSHVPLDTPCQQVEGRTLRTLIDDFAWDVLGHYHDGFENNDGGCGSISIDVAKQSVILDHNDRVSEFVNTTTEV